MKTYEVAISLLGNPKCRLALVCPSFKDGTVIVFLLLTNKTHYDDRLKILIQSFRQLVLGYIRLIPHL